MFVCIYLVVLCIFKKNLYKCLWRFMGECLVDNEKIVFFYIFDIDYDLV